MTKPKVTDKELLRLSILGLYEDSEPQTNESQIAQIEKLLHFEVATKRDIRLAKKLRNNHD